MLEGDNKSLPPAAFMLLQFLRVQYHLIQKYENYGRHALNPLTWFPSVCGRVVEKRILFSYMYLYIYIFIYVYVYVNEFVYILKCVYVYLYIHVNICICICVYVYMYKCICTIMYMYNYVNV